MENNDWEITMSKNIKLQAVNSGQHLFSLRNNCPEKTGHY